MGPVLARYLLSRFAGLYAVLLAASGLFLAAALGLDRGTAALSAADWAELAPLAFLALSPTCAMAGAWLLASNLVRENHLPALQGAGVAPRRLAAVIALAAGLAAALETAASEVLVPARLDRIAAVIERLGFDTPESNYPVLAETPDGGLAGARRMRGEVLDRPWIWTEEGLLSAPSGRLTALADGRTRLELETPGLERHTTILAPPGFRLASPDQPTAIRLRAHRPLHEVLADLEQGLAGPGDGFQAGHRVLRPFLAPVLALLAFLAGLAVEGWRKY